MLRFIKNKVFIVGFVTIILLFVIGVSLFSNDKLEWVSDYVSIPISPVQAFFTKLSNSINNSISFFKDIKQMKEQNEKLKIRVEELEKENRELYGYKEKIKELKEALALKERFSNYEIIGANVIAKDPGNWFDTFKIDVGARDGVRNDYPVVSASKALIGRVDSAGAATSKVISIIDEDTSVSGWISKPVGGHVIVRGDLKLKDRGLCKMEYIPLEVNVEIDDVIETSGLGGIYPKGLIIGKVVEIRKTSSDLSRYAIIQPAVNFKKLEEVYVLKTKNTEDSSGDDR